MMTMSLRMLYKVINKKKLDGQISFFHGGRGLKYKETQSFKKAPVIAVYSSQSISQTESRDGFTFGFYNVKGTINRSVDKKVTPCKLLDNFNEFADDGLIQLKPMRQTEFVEKVTELYVDGRYRYVVKELVATPELLYAAYNNIIESAGDPPKGDPMQMALDNVGIDWFVRTAKELREGTFRVSNNCQDVILKHATKNDEYLRIPKLRLKIVLEALRSVLQEIYEPQFSYMSHGFRNGRGRHTALKQIRASCKGTSWWISFDIRKHFDLENFNILLSALQETIQDRRLFDLLMQMFHSGILELDIGGHAEEYYKENILSPILMNIYFDMLDKEVHQIKERVEASSSVENDPTDENELDLKTPLVDGAPGVKLIFCRYSDEILFALDGPKQLASNIKDEVTAVLKSKLCVDVNPLNSKLVHASSGSVQFVGTDLQFVSVSRLPHIKTEKEIGALSKARHRVRVLAMQQRLHWETGLRKMGSKALTSIVKDSRNPDSGNKFMDKKVMDMFDLLSHEYVQESIKNKENKDTSHEKLARGDALLSPLILKHLPRDLVEAYDNFQSKAAEYLKMRSSKAPGQTGTKLKCTMPATEALTMQEHKLQIFAPMNQLVEKLRLRGIVDKGGEPVHLDVLVSQEDIAIIQWYGGLATTLLDFFRCCDNFSSVKEKVDYHLRRSCLRTLAAKHKSTAYNVAKNFSLELTTHFPTKAELHSMGKTFLIDPKPVDDTLSVVLTKISKETRHAKTCAVIGCCNTDIELYLVRTQRINQPDTIMNIDACPLHLAFDRRGLPLCKVHYVNFCSGRINLQNVRLNSLGRLQEVNQAT